MTASTDPIWIFVPIDPRESIEEESALLDLFASGLAGAVLGVGGLEHWAHLIESTTELSELQAALRPVPTRAQVTQAIRAWRQNPRPFSSGEIPGVWVRMKVPRPQMCAALQQTFPRRRLPDAYVPYMIRPPAPRYRPRPRW